jgi:hypothetical protein
LLAQDVVKVPEASPFIKSVDECERIQFTSVECPVEKLVGFGNIIETACGMVIEELSRPPTDFHRRPPLALFGLARGGKTTTLALLFDAIKGKRLGGQKVNAMMISFNGFGQPLERVTGETQCNAIIRNIVRQLIDPSVDQTKISCTAEVLDAYIGDSPFVLLIDELNHLANPLLPKTKLFLQKYFLSKKNRYLVFTSRYRMNIDPIANGDIGSESDPGVKSISLPTSTDLESLRKMPRCSSLNPATVALYGGIPSLIYSVFSLNNKTPTERFIDAQLRGRLFNDGADLNLLLMQFVQAVITGERNFNLKMFEQFAITNGNKIHWPICYIQCILGLFQETDTTRFILDECNQLVVQSSKTETGFDWECIINIALGFRCLYQQFHGSQSPFNIVPQLTAKPNVLVIALPDDVRSIQEAKTYISKLDKSSFPALVLATPKYASFPIVDGFVAYFSTPEKMAVYGYQAKLGRGLPAHDLTNDLQGLDKFILLQGRAPENDIQPFKGWERWNKEKVQTLLGYSLKDLYPENWSPPTMNSAAAEDTHPTTTKLKS